eukprot:symbB.v1.2.009704.t1/scaffold594.1/size183492/11
MADLEKPPSEESSQDDELQELRVLCRSQAARIVQLENLCTQQKARIQELETERSRPLGLNEKVVSRAGLLASPRTSLGRRQSDVSTTITTTAVANPRPSGAAGEACQRAQDLAELWGQRCAPTTGTLFSPRPSPRQQLVEARPPAVAWRPMQDISRSLLLPAKHVETRLIASPVPAYPIVSNSGSLLVPSRVQDATVSTPSHANRSQTMFHSNQRYGITASPAPLSPRPMWPEAKVSLLWSPVTPRLEMKGTGHRAPEKESPKAGSKAAPAPQAQERVRH